MTTSRYLITAKLSGIPHTQPWGCEAYEFTGSWLVMNSVRHPYGPPDEVQPVVALAAQGIEWIIIRIERPGV